MQIKENFSVMKPADFLADFLSEITRAKRRVWAKVMLIEQGHEPDLIAHALEQSARRGIDTQLVVDNFSLMSSNKRLLNMKMFIQFIEAGVNITFTNPPRIENSIPMIGNLIGRNHQKMFIIDDVAWLGGLNLAAGDFGALDFEVKVTKPEIVDKLAGEFERKTMSRPSKDYQINCDDQTSIIIDVGNPSQSLIFDTAIDLVNGAERSIHNISILLPSGKFLAALNNARKRGVEVNIVATADPKKMAAKPFQILQMVSKATMKAQTILHLVDKGVSIIYYPGLVHAKFLTVDENTAMIGSHNLSGMGVFVGTAEIALLSKDPTLVHNLEEFFKG